MLFRVLPAAVFLFTIISLTACGSKGGSDAQPEARTRSSPIESAAATPSDGVRRVTLAELQDALLKKEAIAVDVRGPVEYELGHVKGARSVPLGLLASRIKELPRDKLIVTYCA
jgi:predicted small lipoprotein YifL